jgi:transcriptional regulator with XRE-family HTH domain
VSMAVDLRTFQYRTDFAAFQPPMLDTSGNTPFAWVSPTPGGRVAEIVRRVRRHLDRLDSLVSGLEVDLDLADATGVEGEPGWVAPIRIAQTLGRGGAREPGTGATPVSVSRRQRAVEAIDRIRELGDLSDERAADLMRVARGTLRSWRAGAREPYPATTRHLFEADSVVSALVRSLGPEGAREWFQQAVPGAASARLDMLGEEEGPSRLLALARQSLFSGRGPRLLPSVEDLEAPDESPAEPEAYEPAAFAGGPVRRRRAP